MPYKPKYCCECREEIERIEWRFWHSRRFCKLCETEYGIYDWLPYLKGIVIVLAVFAISIYFQKPEKPLNVSPNQLLIGVQNGKGVSTSSNSASLNVNSAQFAAQMNSTALAVKAAPAKATDVKTKSIENSPVEPVEKVYFCGAATKKGSPCSRRVRGGGRCWQHVGQTAMLAQEKLLASQ